MRKAWAEGSRKDEDRTAWARKGHKTQHAKKNAEGKSQQAVKAGNATADVYGRTKDGKSICALYRIHARWKSPVTNLEARARLIELGKIDPKTFIPYPKES